MCMFPLCSANEMKGAEMRFILTSARSSFINREQTAAQEHNKLGLHVCDVQGSVSTGSKY